MFINKYGDIITGIFFMALSLLMIIMAKMLPKSAVMEIGPDFMPVCVGMMTFILAMILFVLSIMRLKSHLAEVQEQETQALDYKSVLMSFILILIYVYILRPAGFIVSTILYLPVQMFTLAPGEKRGKKRAVQLLIISLVFTFAVFFLFRYGFKIMLPAGIFTINL